MIKKIIVVTCLLCLLLSCEISEKDPIISHNVGYNEDGEPYYNFPYQNNKEFVFELMKEVYLWNEEINPIDDVNSYETPQDVMNALRTDIDRWSYIAEKEVSDSYYHDGEMLAFGFYFIYVLQDNGSYLLKITSIQEDSELYKAGVRKGDSILAFNDMDLIASDLDMVHELWWSLNDTLKELNTITIQIQSNMHGVLDLSVSPGIINIKTIHSKKIFTQDDIKIGYMSLSSFISITNDELTETFDFFSINSIDELIIDLRGNGGGLLNTASYFIDILLGETQAGDTSIILEHNSKYEDTNSAYIITDVGYDFDFDRVLFLTDHRTASASELLINSLKSYTDVILFGNTTSGKPVGMHGYEHDDFIYFPIAFKFVNADYYGDFFDGIRVDFYLDDDLNFDHGDPDDPIISEAIEYLTTGYITKSRSVLDKNRFYIPHNYGFRESIGLY